MYNSQPPITPATANGMVIMNKMPQVMPRENGSFGEDPKQTEHAWAATGPSTTTAAMTTAMHLATGAHRSSRTGRPSTV